MPAPAASHYRWLVCYHRFSNFNDYVDEELDREYPDDVLSACFYAIKDGGKYILIQDIRDKVGYGWEPK